MRKHSIVVGLMTVAIACVAYASAAGAGDQANHLKARLDGYQEVPSVSSTGSGTLDLRIDEQTETIEYELTYQNLEGAMTAASHIHLGQPGVNGGVSVFLCGGTRPACTPTSGTFSGIITASDVGGPAAQGIAPGEFDELVRALRAGVTYVNVHTNKHPGGEIRGQIR